MKLKQGVRLRWLKPQTIIGMIVCESVYKDAGVDLVITSVSDGQHMGASKHYSGEAFDCRTSNIPDKTTRGAILHELKSQLENDFDIVDEGDHLHIEYDPK